MQYKSVRIPVYAVLLVISLPLIVPTMLFLVLMKNRLQRIFGKRPYPKEALSNSEYSQFQAIKNRLS